MSEKRQKGPKVRNRMTLLVVLCATLALSMGVFGLLTWVQGQQTIDTLLEKQVAQLNLIGEISQDLSEVKGTEKDLVMAPYEGEGRLRELALRLQGQVSALRPKVARLAENVKGVSDREISRSVQFLDDVAEDLVTHGEDLTAPLAEGETLPNLDEEYRVFAQDLRDLAVQLPQARRSVVKAAEQLRQGPVGDQTLLLFPAFGSVVALILLLMAMVTARRRAEALQQLNQGIAAVQAGQFMPVELKTKDDLAAIAGVFNETLERLKGSIVTDQEREESQSNLIGFLEVVSEAADGDLTVKAPVTADAFGSIADAYNLMVDSLSDLLTDTSDKAHQVGTEARRLLEIFRDMEQGSERQDEQVEAATRAVNQTSDTTLEIADKVSLAQETAARVDEATGQGNARVQQNIEGMQLIRITVQVINKKMKSLSERLLEIGTISQLISEIATRTTILAMNASIEAARAGDQGRGFLVISDEIKRLADKSAEATKQIGGIIKAIQTEAGEVTGALEEETKTVEDQTRLAQAIGDAFLQIQGATRSSREVVSEIYNLSQSQQQLTGEAVQSMASVSAISKETMALVKDSSRISEGLNAVSQTLLGSLSQFKLSGEPEVSLLEEPEELSEEENLEEGLSSPELFEEDDDLLLLDDELLEDEEDQDRAI